MDKPWYICLRLKYHHMMSHVTSVLLDQYVDRAEYLFFLILQIYIKVSAASSQIDEQSSRFSIDILSP